MERRSRAAALSLLALITTTLTLLQPPSSARAVGNEGGFFVGYNQAWFDNNYGTDLTSKFELPFVEKNLAELRAAGGSVVRLMLFTARQGLRYEGSVTTGLSAELLANLETVLGVARKNHLKVYLTAIDANEAVKVAGEWRRFYELLLNDDDAIDAFDRLALAPLLGVLERNRDVIFGMDLINEMDAAVSRGFFTSGDQTHGARHWIERNAAFVKAKAPWLKVTASVGWGGAQRLITNGLVTGIGLDFYDLHVYSDSGEYSGATALCAKVKSDGVPIILGEFGQLSKTVDDRMQTASTAKFLGTAASLCFSGALAWVFDASLTPWWSFRGSDGRLRRRPK